MASSKGAKAIQQIIGFLAKDKSFDRHISKLKVLSGGDGKLVCEMNVGEEDTNRMGSLHGGMTATLVDCVSTLALMSGPRAAPGVSVDMNITYMKGAKVGEDIVIDANTLRAGKTLAFLTVDIKNVKGELLAQGRHTKFIGGQ